jgi:hypothetical protein
MPLITVVPDKEPGLNKVMKKKILFICCLIIGLNLNGYSCAFGLSEEKTEAQSPSYACAVSKELAPEAGQINLFLSDYFKALKTHSVKKIGELYANNYKSEDGFNKTELMKLLKDSWEASPDLTYSQEIKDIRLSGNSAAIELYENVKGTTKQMSDITKDKGLIESTSKSVMYLARFGNGWKIVSDNTLYEQTSLKYGAARNFNINIDVPEVVLPSDNYTISLRTEIPDNMFAIGSITKEKLTASPQRQEEVFRQVPVSMNLLERVVKAGDGEENELAVGAVSYCEVSKNPINQPVINLTGTAVVMKRVNIIKNAPCKK